MLINMVVVAVFALVNGVVPTWGWLLVPVVLAELYLLALGISFLLGAINVKFRDIVSIWEVIMQGLFYAVPIIYPISMVASSSPLVAQIMLLNPIAQAIQDVRYLLITNETVTSWSYLGTGWTLVPVILVVVLFIFAIWVFHRKAAYFAEEV